MPKKVRSGGDRVFLQNAVKTLAANIRFASVDNPMRSIVVTSSVPNEGKTTIAVELARALAAGGKRVLLVECDMRRRSVAAMIGAHSRHGIYAVLSNQASLESAMVETSQRGLFFLDCEPHIPNPVDILSSKRFRNFIAGACQVFDFVLFDTPPLTAFVDASVIAAEVDGTLLVVRQNFVRRDELAGAYEQLKTAKANVIGAVMNYCETEKSEYYYSYYTKDEKPSAVEFDAPTVRPPAAASATPAPTSMPQVKKPAPAPQPASTPSPSAVPGLKPLPDAPSVDPGSTAQFLAGTSYRPRTYTDE